MDTNFLGLSALDTLLREFEFRDQIVINKDLLLSRAEQCKDTAARCIDRDVAAKFMELAIFYQSLAGTTEMKLSAEILSDLRPKYKVEHVAEP